MTKAKSSLYITKHKKLKELLKDKLKNISKHNIHESNHAIFHAMSCYKKLNKEDSEDREDWGFRIVANFQKKIKALRQIYIDIPEARGAAIDSKVLEINELIIMTLADIRKTRVSAGIEPLIFDAMFPFLSELHSEISYRKDCLELFDNFVSLLGVSIYLNMRSPDELLALKETKTSAKELNRADREISEKFKGIDPEPKKEANLLKTPAVNPNRKKKKSVLRILRQSMGR